MQLTAPTTLVILAALASLIVSLVPSIFLADFVYVGSATDPAIRTLQRQLAFVIVPPNFVATHLGFYHLEYIHLLDPPSGSSPPHDFGPCRCTPREQRADFLAVAWPLWFIIIFGSAMTLRAGLKTHHDRSAS
jgi:hypothetical protein